MNGDGLSDIVIITNESVFYYPNLGYGRFGARVTMNIKGCFTNCSLFDPKFVHLADIDGSGTTDIIYTGEGLIQLWINESGNGLRKETEFRNPFPELDDHSRISFNDLLGKGTSCLVWSSSLPKHHNHLYLLPHTR